MMNRYLGIGSLLFLGLLGTSSGCSSAQSTCELQAECGHWSDQLRDYQCFFYRAQEEAAQAYECSDQWEDYMACVQEKGTCNEKESEFTTRENGKCNETEAIGGVTCMSNADCDAIGSSDPLSCVNNECAFAVCSGDNDRCTSDADCIGIGEDVCESKIEAVQTCVDKASGGVSPNFF
jgi:hypothetical protein